jgi:hypothetical protein
MYLEVNLPSLLAPGNLPAFAALHEIEYHIHTTAEDAARIESTPAFAAARKFVKFVFTTIQPNNYPDPITAHHALWRESIEIATRAGAVILFVPPDVVWGDGGLKHVAEHFQQGKKAVFMTYVRVVSETAVPEVKRLFQQSDEPSLKASSRDLVALMLRHIHPLALTYQRDSQNFPIHPEFILWTIPGEGFLMRVLVREMFAYDPRYFTLNPQALLARKPDPNLIELITDSDDLFALSLAPYAKDIEWYVEPARLSVLKIARWWLIYDSPFNEVVARRYFYVHAKERTLSKWRRAEIESDQFIQRLVGTREILRVVNKLSDPELAIAQMLIMLSLSETRLASGLSPAAGLTLLIPNNVAMRRLLGASDEMTFADRNPELLRLVLHHILAAKLDLAAGEKQTLATAAGTVRHLSWHGGRPHIDGIPIEQLDLEIEPHNAFVLDTVVLPPSKST